ncbi:MAG: SCO family protein [Limisphaerales bacterium]
MKNYLSILATILTLGQLTLLAAPTCCSTNVPANGPFTDASLYQIESQWTSDYGKTFKLAQLRGRVQIVTLFFTSCQYACPILVHDMKKIEAGLHAAGITNIGYLLVTMDTERDTVDRLHTFRTERDLNDNWLLLRGESQDVLELGMLLGVKYKKETNGQFAHSNIITLLNPQGEIVHQQVGLNLDPAPVIKAVAALASPP